VPPPLRASTLEDISAIIKSPVAIYAVGDFFSTFPVSIAQASARKVCGADPSGGAASRNARLTGTGRKKRNSSLLKSRKTRL